MKRKQETIDWKMKYEELLNKNYEKQYQELKKNMIQIEDKYNKIIDELNQELNQYKNISHSLENIMDLKKELASVKLKHLEDLNDKDKLIQNLQDRLSFYETLSNLIIENEKDDVYYCMIQKSNLTLKFTFKPCFDDQISKIEYRPLSFYNNNIQLDLKLLPDYLRKKIKFEEVSSSSFLWRMFQTLEEFNKK